MVEAVHLLRRIARELIVEDDEVVEKVAVEALVVDVPDIQAVGHDSHHHVVQVDRGEVANVVEDFRGRFPRDDETRALRECFRLVSDLRIL